MSKFTKKENALRYCAFAFMWHTQIPRTLVHSPLSYISSFFHFCDALHAFISPGYANWWLKQEVWTGQVAFMYSVMFNCQPFLFSFYQTRTDETVVFFLSTIRNQMQQKKRKQSKEINIKLKKKTDFTFIKRKKVFHSNNKNLLVWLFENYFCKCAHWVHEHCSQIH